MQLDRLALHLRRRSPWEAIDLGCAMARTWWLPLMAAWLSLYLPAAVVAHAVLDPFGALCALWWLKPVFDRAALEVLARRVFGEHPGVLEVLRAVWRSPGLLASLTFYRFDLARSFNLPVWHLERMRGRAASTRARALHGRSRRHAVWATIVFLHFEGVLLFSLWGAIDLFTPAPYASETGMGSTFFADAPLWRQWLQSGFYVLTVTLLEPFYVAAGFALYLNRRTQLEAWDVELALRRYAGRTSQRRAGAAQGLLISVLVPALALAIVLLPDPGLAAEAAPRSAREAVQEILKAPEFSTERDVSRLRYTGSGWGLNPDEPREAKPSSFGAAFAEIARVLMWVAAAMLVLAALYYSRRYWGKWFAQPGEQHVPPASLFGLDIAPQTLPADVATAALAALDAGRAREALSLLYRGALSALVHNDALEVAPGDTEGDCVRQVAATGTPERAGYFRDLVAAWQTAAYARRLPADAALRALCSDWRVHFAQRADA